MVASLVPGIPVEVRVVLHSAPLTRDGLRQVVAVLPEEDAELLGWINDTVARADADQFERLVFAAAIAGRKLPTSLLSQDYLEMFRNGWRFGWVAAQLEGDVMAVLLTTSADGITRLVSAFVMFVATRWWIEHRPGEAFPSKLLAAVRNFRNFPDLTKGAVSVMGATALLMKDTALAEIWGGKGRAADQARELNLRRIEAFLTKPLEEWFPEKEKRGYFGGQPMRRAVADHGRNEKCHCGSAKKYKFCCLNADQERLRHSSPVAGKTWDELADDDGPLTTTEVMQMTLPELAQKSVAAMEEEAQPCALKRLAGAERFDVAVEAFQELGVPERLLESWKVALQYAVRAWNRDALVRLLDAPGEEAPPVEELECGVRLLLASDDPKEFCAAVETESLALLKAHDSEGLQDLVAGLCWSPYPALGIMVARGALLLTEPAHSAWIFSEILTKRGGLELPIDDPSADLLDERASRRHPGDSHAGLEEAQAKLEKKAAEVREVREKLAALQREIMLREKREQRMATAQAPAAAVEPAEATELREMRSKMQTLKALLSERGEERVKSRREVERLQAEVAELKAAQQASGAMGPEDTDEPPGEPLVVEGQQPLRKVDLPSKIYGTLASFPPQVGRGVMTLLGRLAAGDPTAFKGLVKIYECEDVLRARVAGDYRLLLRLTPDAVEVCAVVNRRDLQREAKLLRAKGV